jgi:hypothetical protein
MTDLSIQRTERMAAGEQECCTTMGLTKEPSAALASGKTTHEGMNTQ